jgi:hypothetical protein
MRLPPMARNPNCGNSLNWPHPGANGLCIVYLAALSNFCACNSDSAAIAGSISVTALREMIKQKDKFVSVIHASKPVRLLRRALKAVLGFDVIHTWRNRAEMLRSDVIWTHTEQEWLSAALMLLLSGRKAGADSSPLLLAQSV